MPGLGIGIGLPFNKRSSYPTVGLDIIVYFNSTYEDGGTTYVQTSKGIGLPVISGTGLDRIIDYTSNYNVEVWISTNNVDFTKHGDSASTPYAMTGLTAGTKYWVKLRAVNGSKYSQFTQILSATTIIEVAFLAGDLDFINNKWLDESGNNNDAILTNASARTSSSGNLDYTITGLLTSDTIEVVAGSNTPTIPSNDILRISEGQTVYGVTIKRSGAIWAIIPFCEPKINNIPTTSYDVSGNGHHAVCTGLGFENIAIQNNYFYLAKYGYSTRLIS